MILLNEKVFPFFLNIPILKMVQKKTETKKVPNLKNEYFQIKKKKTKINNETEK